MNAAKHLVRRLSHGFNALLPTEKRDAVKKLLQDFAYVYPKLAVFLSLNVALAAIPLLCFALFALVVFLLFLVAALVVAIVVTLLATTFAILGALLLLLPAIFFTTFCACSLFFWGLVAYYIFVHLRRPGATSSDNANRSTGAVPSDNNEWEHLDGPVLSKDAVAADMATSSKDATRSDDASPSDDAVPLADDNQSTYVVPSDKGRHTSDKGMDGNVDYSSEGSDSWRPGTDAKSLNRPKVEAKDSAVGLELASPAVSSLVSSKPTNSRSRKSFRNSPISTPLASPAPGKPFQFAKLRKEHPDGLRQDSKGLFKVDEIASDSSLDEPDREQRPHAHQPRRKRSASSFTSMSQDHTTTMQPLKRGQTAIHLPTDVKPKKLTLPATISQTRTLSMPEFQRSLDHNEVTTTILKEGINPATGVISAPVNPNATNADIEDNCDSEHSSRKSSGEIERLVDDTTSADEMDFAKMPPTPDDKRGTSTKSNISPYTGEIVESYFGEQGVGVRY